MKLLRLIIFIAALALALFIGRQAYLYFGKGTITITATPPEATITIDKNVYTSATAKDIAVSPTTHKIQISLDGFTTIDQEIDMGWQEAISKQYILKPKPLKDIYESTADAVDLAAYNVVQEKFFINNTWAAGYIVPKVEDEGDISVLVLHRVGKTWKLVLQSNSLPGNAAQQLPAAVYDYIKDFGSE